MAINQTRFRRWCVRLSQTTLKDITLTAGSRHCLWEKLTVWADGALDECADAKHQCSTFNSLLKYTVDLFVAHHFRQTYTQHTHDISFKVTHKDRVGRTDMRDGDTTRFSVRKKRSSSLMVSVFKTDMNVSSLLTCW